MSLNVRVKSQRHFHRPGGVYRAVVELNNPDAVDVVYVVEGLCVQCHGVEVVDPGWVAASYYAAPTSPVHHKDGRRVVRTLFSARANQLLDRLVFIAPGQDKQFGVACTLPEKLPPSFRGTSVRYLYEIHVGVKFRLATYGERGGLRKSVEKQAAQSISLRKTFNVCPNTFDETRINNKSTEDGVDEDVPLLDVCFRGNEEVRLQWSEVSDDDKTSSTEGSIFSRVMSEESSSTANIGSRMGRSFRSSAMSRMSLASRSSLPETEISYVAPVTRRTASITHAEAQSLMSTRMHSRLYNLRYGNETLVLLSFNPSMTEPLRPGSTIGGVLRLVTGSDHAFRCLSYAVMLETEEHVAETWRSDPSKRVIRCLHCEHSEFTGDVFVTNFLFTIPSNAPPSFRTSLLSFKWLLKFEFEVGQSIEWAETGDAQPSHDNKGATEPLLWQLPLTVYPQ